MRTLDNADLGVIARYEMTGRLVLVPEQPSRFLDFGEILRRIEACEGWRKHLGYRPGTTICAVETRKSKCAAQFERLCVLVSGNFQGRVEGIFGGRNV